jgi:hypothetical protein
MRTFLAGLAVANFVMAVVALARGDVRKACDKLTIGFFVLGAATRA